jgi:hypothetical protein
MLVCGWLLAAGAQVVWGQGDPSGAYFYQRDLAPIPYGDPYLVPGYSGMEQAGYPPQGQYWPGVDIYRPGINQHYTENGFWFNRIISGRSRYFFTVEALITRTGAPPHTLIGATNVNNVTPLAADVLGEGSQHSQRFVERTVNSANFEPDRDFQGGQNTDVPIFIEQDAGVLQQHIGSGGVRGSWGWWNPDGSGFMVQGYWQDVARSSFELGYLPSQFESYLYMDVLNPANVNNNFLTHLQPWFGLPLPGADRDRDGLNGVVVPYDMYVQFEFRTNTFGGNLDWYFTPIFDRDYFKIRPLVGGRYLMVNESFSFRAADSGLGYTLEPSDVDVGGGTGQNQNVNFLLQISELDGGFALPDPIESYLLSKTQNQFGGPEVGLRFDFGGEKAKIWLQSKFGLLAYYNTREVSGFNIGDHYSVLITDPDVNGDGIPDNPTRAAGKTGTTFRDAKSNTTVAPMFEQGVFVQAPILKYVPLINKMSVFEKADFQAGYTVLVLGNVYRAVNDINWQQYPNFPTAGNGRSVFYTTNWSLGVQWNY